MNLNNFEKTKRETRERDFSLLLEKFASREVLYRYTHRERMKDFEDDEKVDYFLDLLKREEELFTRYLHIFSAYEGEVVFLDKELIKLEAKTFIDLPKDYALKGGAARKTLEMTLGCDSWGEPRDIDICYIGDPSKEDRELSFSLAQKYSPEDLEHGYGVEHLEEDYFETRDFTLNEVLVVGESIVLTKQALLDTMRSVLRFTDYEKTNYYFQDVYGEDEEIHVRFVNDKLAAKALRFIAEREGLTFIDDDFFQNKYINTFHMALHLDRAMQRGKDVADAFVQKLKEYKQIPESINTPLECIEYISESTHFIYRHLDAYQEDDFSIETFEKKYLETFGESARIEERYHEVIDFFENETKKKFSY